MTTATAKRPRILEKHVQDGVTAFLELDGWRAIRTDPVSDRRRGKGFGEIGMADHLYLRYMGPLSNDGGKEAERTWIQAMWIEYKAPSKKATPHQLKWHDAERRRGALVLVVDDFDKFREWYADSGLNRRMLSGVALGRKQA